MPMEEKVDIFVLPGEAMKMVLVAFECSACRNSRNVVKMMLMMVTRPLLKRKKATMTVMMTMTMKMTMVKDIVNRISQRMIGKLKMLQLS